MIYLITGFSLENEETEFVERSRCFGYKLNFEKAENAVKSNVCDINEAGYYPYAVIEEVEEGIHPIPTKESFYKFNEKTYEYEPIEKPKQLEHYCCFGIG